MRILFLAYAYDGHGKSESLTAYNLVRGLRNRGHEVAVLTKSAFIGEGVINISCSNIIKKRAGVGKNHQLDYFEFIYKAYRKAKIIAPQYDIIQHGSPISLRYPDPLSKLGKPFIFGPVGGSIDYPPGFKEVKRKESLLQRLRILDAVRLKYDPLLRSTLALSSAIVLTSNAATRKIPAKYHERMHVIPEGIALDGPSLPGDRAGNYIFSSGRLIPYKANDLLIKAFAKIAPYCTSDLWITGHGPERPALENLVATLGMTGRVKLLGKVNRLENLSLMSRSLFCVFPALTEAFGIVNLEAMACQKALIVTDWGGPSDIVEHGVSGFKVIPRSIDSFVGDLATYMQKLLNDLPLRTTMEENGLRRLHSYFTIEKTAKRFEDVYNIII